MITSTTMMSPEELLVLAATLRLRRFAFEMIALL
jgi:hypothetical protein